MKRLSSFFGVSLFFLAIGYSLISMNNDVKLIFFAQKAKIQSAPEGLYLLTLTNVRPFVDYLVNEPTLDSGKLSLEKLTAYWQSADHPLKSDPSKSSMTASIRTPQAGEQIHNISFQLRDPTYQPKTKTLTFNITFVSGSGFLPEKEFENVTLFLQTSMTPEILTSLQ